MSDVELRLERVCLEGRWFVPAGTEKDPYGWQPIETMPKTHEGRYSRYVFLAAFEDGKWRIGKGSWVADMFIEHGVGPIKPSHWMWPNPPVRNQIEAKETEKP